MMKRATRVTFMKTKSHLFIDDIDVNKMLTSNKEPYGKKLHLNTLLDMMITTTLDHYI